MTSQAGGPGPDVALLSENAPSRSELIDLYKMYVANAEAVVSRRQSVNTFFLSINTLLLSAIALVTQFGTNRREGAFAIAIMSATGAVLAFVWRSALRLYGRQRKSMFVVVYELENNIGARLFQREWADLNGDRDPATWRTFTVTEARVPTVFFVVYLVSVVGAVAVAAAAIAT